MARRRPRSPRAPCPRAAASGLRLHQQLVDVGAGVALVAVGDDELRPRPRRARANSHFMPAGKPAPPRPRTSAALTSSSSCLGRQLASALAQAGPVAGRGSAPARRAGSRSRARARRRASPASTRSTTPGPASITSPSRTAGRAWQKPRQTVSASETCRPRERSPSSRPSPSRDRVDVGVAGGGEARRAGADAHVARAARLRAGRRRRSRRRRPPPRAGPSARRRPRRSSSVISPRSSIASLSTSSAVGAPRSRAAQQIGEVARHSEQRRRPPLLVDVDVEGGRGLAEPGHLLHVAAQRHEPAGAGVGAHVADREREVARAR